MGWGVRGNTLCGCISSRGEGGGGDQPTDLPPSPSSSTPFLLPKMESEGRELDNDRQRKEYIE